MRKRYDFLEMFFKIFPDLNGIDFTSIFIEIDTSMSGLINYDKLHNYLVRLPCVFSSRDAEAIVDRIQKDKSSI